MNLYIFIIALVACFTFKTFASEKESSKSEFRELKTKQLELIIKTIEDKPKKKNQEVSVL